MKKLFLVVCLFANLSLAFAQSGSTSLVNEMAGSWALVSVSNIFPDGSTVYPYGTDPKGLLMFDTKGNYAIQILKAQRPKIVSNDKNKCTPEENASIVQGTNSHFGKYIFDEKNKTISFKIEWASFTNWEKTEQNRLYLYDGKQLKYTVTHTTQGGQSVIAEVVWQKL